MNSGKNYSMKSESEYFSVLMSLYNKETSENLEECLESLYKQTLHANEIVIVIDGPINEGLTKVLKKWTSELPLKIHPISNNVGLGKALNIGLEQCSNDIIFRMDTDDICYPMRFEIQYSYFRKHPDLTVLGTAINEFDECGISGERFTVSGHENIVAFSRKRNPMNHMTVVFRKSKVIDAGGFQHHLFMEDYNLWLRLISRQERFDNISKPLVLARVGKGMLERRKGTQYIKSEYQLWKLKQKLKIDSGISAFFVFITRVIPRMLPTIMLSTIYKILRLQVKK